MEAKILIVGAGPTGLMAALTLAGQGIPFRIIDKHSAPVTTSNALAIQSLTMELWEKMGLIEEALKLGYPVKGLTISRLKGELGRISLEGLPTKYPFILILPQAKTENMLIQRLAKLGVTVERNVCLQSLTEYEDRIEVVCSDEIAEYEWVIGCDGANSTVRKSLDIPFQGKDFSQHFIMADLYMKWDKPSDFANAVVSEEGPMIFFPFDDTGLGRIVIDVTGDDEFEQGKQPSLEDFQRLVKERAGSQAVLSNPLWISGFRIQGRVAQSYRKGRVFLAGDAAHRHSPFGGQGLNIGIQDAHFLASLLGKAMYKGRFGELDRYEKVRRYIGETIVRRTSIMTQLITSRSKVVQSVRNFMIHLLLKIKPVRYKMGMILSELIYREY